MDSIRTRILDRVIEELNAQAKPADVPQVTLDAFEVTPADDGPSMRVLLMEDEPAPRPNRAAAPTRSFLLVGIECAWHAELPALRQRAIEPMLAWTAAALGDTNLNGLALSVEQGKTVWARNQADRFYVSAVATFLVEYQTARRDPTQKQ